MKILNLKYTVLSQQLWHLTLSDQMRLFHIKRKLTFRETVFA